MVDEFILAMVPRVAARKDVVILEGTMGREMYLLSTGLMEVRPIGRPWLMRDWFPHASRRRRQGNGRGRALLCGGSGPQGGVLPCLVVTFPCWA